MAQKKSAAKDSPHYTQLFIILIGGVGWAFIASVIYFIQSVISPLFYLVTFPAVLIDFFIPEGVIQGIFTMFTRLISSVPPDIISLIVVGFGLFYVLLVSCITVPLVFLGVKLYKFLIVKK